MVLFLSKEYLDKNVTFYDVLYAKYPRFFVAEHYGLRNSSSWGSKDLVSAVQGIRELNL
jgi:hypothetical protein